MTIAAPTSRAISAIVDDAPEIRRSVLRRAWIFCRRQPLGTFGMLIVVITAIAGLSADWIAPYNPTANDFCGDDRGAELGALARVPISSGGTSCRASFSARARR